MAKASLRTSEGVYVEGLDETIRALRRFDKEVGREAVDIFRDEAKVVQANAKARAKLDPAAPSNSSWIGRSATSKGAGVTLLGHKGKFRAHATEWGMGGWQHRTWGGEIRRTTQSAMKRRTFRRWHGSGFDVKGGSGPGNVIQPAIRKHLPGMEKRVATKLHALLNRTLDKAGVRR